MVLHIGALKSGRDAEVAGRHRGRRRGRPRGRRDRQGHLRERLPDRRREDPGLPPDRGRRRRLRQDLDRVRARRRDPRRPAADARQHLAARPGQGRRRRPDAGRAARGHEPGHDPDRRHGDQDHHRRLPGAQGRRRTRRGRDGARSRAATDDRACRSASGCSAPASSASSTPTACATCRTPGSWPTTAPGRSDAPRSRRASAAGPPTRSRPCAPIPRSTSSSSRCRTSSTSRPSRPPRRTARASPAPSRSGGTATEAAEMLRLVEDAGVFHAYLENVVFNGEMIRMREMVEAGAIGRLTTFRAREGHSGPHAAHFWDAELAGGGALLDMASHGTEAPATCSARTSPVRDVFAWGDTLVHGERTTGEDNAVMLIRFEDGRVATMRRLVVVARAASRAASRPTATPGGSSRTSARPRSGRSSSGRPAISARRSTRRPAGSIPVPDETYVHGHDAMMADDRRGVPGRSGAARDVRRRAHRQPDPRRRVPLDPERPLGAGRRRCPRRGPGMTMAPLDDAGGPDLADGRAALLERLAGDPGRGDRDGQPMVRRGDRRRRAGPPASGPATRASRSRRCSRATARIRASTRSSSCR